MSQEEEIAYYEKMVASIPSGVKDQLPQTLQSKDALFLFLLLQEGGFLDNELKPAIRKEDGEINQTLYAYIADAVCTALNIRQGKWKIFEATPRRIPLYSHAGLFGVYGVFTVPL